MAAYAATVTLDQPTRAVHLGEGWGFVTGEVDITNYNQTLAEITNITKRFKAGAPKCVIAGGISDNGHLFEWVDASKAFKVWKPGGTEASLTATTGTVDDNDDAATLGHALYVIPAAPSVRNLAFTAEASATGLIKDSDTAATDGVAVYVVVDDPSFHATYALGHFEFVSPTDANGTCTVATGADTLTLYDDDDAATNGVVIRAVAAGAGLEATTAAAKDILVPTSTGKYIHINHATTGSTPTVYFDEDAANTYERLQAVVVDNADEPYKLTVDATESSVPVPSQGNPGRLASIVTVGPKPFTYTVGSGGPEITIASRPDAASLPGAVALYVQAAGAGLNAANFGKEDLYVVCSDGQFVKIAYAASPAGVQVYGYPEGATADLRWLAVVVDNADETFTTDILQGWVRDLGAAVVATEAASDVDAGAAKFIAFGLLAGATAS